MIMPVKKYDIGWVDAFQSGKLYSIRVAGRKMVLARREDEFFALRDVCPHQGAKLSSGLMTGEVVAEHPGQQPKLRREGEFLSCPWHGWKIVLRTGCSPLEESECVKVRRYEVHVEGERVLVVLSAKGGLRQSKLD